MTAQVGLLEIERRQKNMETNRVKLIVKPTLNRATWGEEEKDEAGS